MLIAMNLFIQPNRMNFNLYLFYLSIQEENVQLTQLYVANQAISAWSNRQYEEISHGTTNGPPGRMLRIFLPIIDVLNIKLNIYKANVAINKNLFWICWIQ